MFEALNITLPGISIPVALSAVALIGYLMGRSRRGADSAEQSAAIRDLKRARVVVRDLETMSSDIRSGLQSHTLALQCFKARLNQMGRAHEGVSWRDLSEEAECILKPTMHLARQMGNAYDELRQHSHALLTFTEVRTDPLTKVNNRRAFDETVANLFAMLTRYGNSFAIAIFDIDHFKALNDEHGHIHGDEVLKEVADTFREVIRETDFIARYGGEEFVVLMPATDLDGARLFADRAREFMAEKTPVTVSGGVAMANETEDAAMLVARADLALYAAKEAGRNRIYEHDNRHITAVTIELDDEDTVSDSTPVGAIAE